MHTTLTCSLHLLTDTISLHQIMAGHCQEAGYVQECETCLCSCQTHLMPQWTGRTLPIAPSKSCYGQLASCLP